MTNFTYNWNLADLENVPKNGLKVFSCFACGGGSTMGYKMGGFDVIGANEIDPEMASIYKLNHNPKYLYNEDIRIFKKRNDLPKELFNLDILDGSPPCSSFSMAGNREKDWGKKKIFREGQVSQTLDDLFFDFIDIAHKLQPKVVISENVKGIIQGNARGYVKKILQLFNIAGYDTQLFLLNGATMGLPQKRERVFFISKRKDLNFNKIILNFNEKQVTVKEAFDSIKEINTKGKFLTPTFKKYWYKMRNGQGAGVLGKYNQFKKIQYNEPSFTLTGNSSMLSHPLEPRNLSVQEMSVISSFPLDYKTNGLGGYQMGMSVPPLMMYKISREIYNQLFKNQLSGTK
jgi:DNA (cytosine-5)-methyltransferase 1